MDKTQSYGKITELISRTKFRVHKINRFTKISGWILSFTVLILTFSITDLIVPVSFKIRVGIYWILVGYTTIFLVYILYDWFFRRIPDNEIVRLIQDTVPVLHDDLINTVDLNRVRNRVEKHFSLSLIDAQTVYTADKVHTLSPVQIYPATRLKQIVYSLSIIYSIVILLILIFPQPVTRQIARIVTPYFNSGIDKIYVTPGNTTLLAGSNLNVNVNTLFFSPRVPVLRYRTLIRPWQKIKMNTYSSKQYRWDYKEVKENIEYQIIWNDVASPVFLVKVIAPPEIGNIELTYNYPNYTGLPLEKVPVSNGNIECLLGTRVRIQAQSNQPVKKAKLTFQDGEIVPLEVRDGDLLIGEIYVVKDNVYRFNVENQAGFTNSGMEEKTVKIIKDQSPEITLNSPDEDLVVSEKAKIKLTYTSRDDYGVREVSLKYRILSTGKENRLLIRKYQPVKLTVTDEYDWDLDNLNLSPGEFIEYYLEVKDNDIVTGPNLALSQTRRIEVFSFENEHYKIEQELATFREDMLSLLNHQIKTRELAKQINQITEPRENNARWTELTREQNNISKQTEKVTDSLNQTIARMKDDPLSEQRVVYEHQQIARNLDYLKSTPMQEVMQSINVHDSTETVKKQTEIVANLEKMALLSEDVLEYQRMYDLLSQSQTANELGSKLTQSLNNISQLDPQTMQELKDTLDKINELMNKIGELINKKSDELPEDFVNQPAIKELNLAQTQDISQQLQQALSSGNLSKAKDLAKQLMQSLNKMLETMQTVAQNSVYPAMSNLAQEMEKQVNEIDELIKTQNSLIERTQPYEDKRLTRKLKQQEELLTKLAEKQKGAIFRVNEILNESIPGLSYPEVKPVIINQLNLTLPKMNKVYTELVNLQVRETKSLLPEIIISLNNIFPVLNPPILNDKMQVKRAEDKLLSTTTDQINIITELETRKSVLQNKISTGAKIVSQLKVIKEIEEEILTELNKDIPSSSLFAGEDKDKLNQLAREQSTLGEQTNKMFQKVQNLTRKSAGIDASMLDNLKEAVNSMDRASGRLNEQRTELALPEEKDAAARLMQGRETFQNNVQQMKEMAQKQGQPSSGFVQHRTGGIYGTHAGQVILPGKDDYLPPKEFREEILDALKEKYPAMYEKIVREYFKRLTE